MAFRRRIRTAAPEGVPSDHASVGRSYLAGLALNVVLIALSLLVGFHCGEHSSVAHLLPQMGERLDAVRARAAGHTFQVFGNNAAVGARLTLLSAVPAYGPAIAGWKLGFPLGALSRSMIDGANRPSAVALALLLPHGLPEYAGFVLMLNSLTMWHFALAGFLRGRRVRWSLLLRCGAASFASGVVVLGAAAAVECYITPAVAGILVEL